ncbi:MAG: serine O-acetyltransferase EpsC [Butyribacter sp.]|nr:serine acetyltransferase [bacterium]MDY3854242.1 serine O-acetyltransferase EpsC [Butyribacter sp.]
MFSELDLHHITQQIADNYSNNELFYVKEGHQMPNRDTIIHIILGLRQIMFPGYFDDEHLGRTLPDFFLGHNLVKLYNSLYSQIIAALAQQQKEVADDVAISKKTDEICTAFFSALPDIQKLLMKDVQAAYDGDPAAHSKEEIIFCYPGLLAIFVYRIAHELYRLQVPFIPRIMSEYAHSHSGIDINPGATIGEYFFIDHGTGVVIGETTIIGNNVKIYQGVTLGALSTRSGQLLRNVKRHPTIEDDVTIYSSASILGGETVIGKGSVIGGNAFITESVPAGSRVSVKKQELSITEKKPKNDLFD